ncbi:NlpC/P60 family protein [Methylobacterium sp. Leaf106]|uniref:NlpC/P60 family protein n=1 Tax=Methylobacterium sp. Leaf106 TaxID=1736255 RepID=UPI000AECFF1F|nr:NlpC/P60 family protein [Methylobacterium sp. Leaf106]
MHWSAPYVGLPWQERGLTRDGIACWGLACLVYREYLGITVPDYAAQVACIAEKAEVAAVFAESTSAAGPWIRKAPEDAEDFDILVFRVGALDAHVGIRATPGRMLHATSGQAYSGIVDYSRNPWVHRLTGVYRHREVETRNAF